MADAASVMVKCQDAYDESRALNNLQPIASVLAQAASDVTAANGARDSAVTERDAKATQLADVLAKVTALEQADTVEDQAIADLKTAAGG